MLLRGNARLLRVPPCDYKVIRTTAAIALGIFFLFISFYIFSFSFPRGLCVSSSRLLGSSSFFYFYFLYFRPSLIEADDSHVAYSLTASAAVAFHSLQSMRCK